MVVENARNAPNETVFRSVLVLRRIHALHRPTCLPENPDTVLAGGVSGAGSAPLELIAEVPATAFLTGGAPLRGSWVLQVGRNTALGE